MKIENKALVLDLLEWIAIRPRTYAEAMEAWRTSCPRLPIWEDALELGLIVCRRGADVRSSVALTATGRTLLEAERPAANTMGRESAVP